MKYKRIFISISCLIREEALIEAQKQIDRKKYEKELIEGGVAKENIIKAAVAFKGKELIMKWR